MFKMRLTTRMLVPCINNKDSRPTLQPLISDQLYIIAPCLSNVRTNQTGKRWREGWERIFNVWWLSYPSCLYFGEWRTEPYSDSVYNVTLWLCICCIISRGHLDKMLLSFILMMFIFQNEYAHRVIGISFLTTLHVGL